MNVELIASDQQRAGETRLKFTVKDTGKGIKQEEMSSLFKMF